MIKASSRQFIKNVASGPLKVFLNAAIVFFSYRYFLQIFGADKFSIWLLLSVIIEFSKMGNLGINDIIIKYIAESNDFSDKRKLYEYTSSSFAIICSFSLLVAIILLLAKDFIPIFLNIPVKYMFLFQDMYIKILLLSLLIIIMEFLLGILYGLGRADLANYLQFSSVFFGTILSIILVYLKFDIFGLYLGNLFGVGCVIAISLYSICQIVGRVPFKINYINLEIIKNIIRNSSIMFGASIINLFFLPAGKILLARYIGSSEVVSYDLSFKLGFQIRAFFDSALKSLVPEFSVLTNEKNKIKQMLVRTYKYLIVAAVPVYGVIYIFSKKILVLWLSDAYVEGLDESFRFILVGMFINLYAVPIYYLLLGKGYFSKLLIGYLIQSAVMLSLAIAYFVLITGKSYEMFLEINVLAMVLATIYLWYMYYKIIICSEMVVKE